MGLISKLLSFTRVNRHDSNLSDVKVDPGGGPYVTAEHFAPAGDDSHPLPTDYPLIIRVQKTGKYAAIGYIDPNNAQTAEPGGKRIYGRDPEGNQVNELWLKNDGDILADNDAAYIEIKADGTITADNDSGSIVITPAGQITLENGGGSVVIETSGQITSDNGSGSVDIAAGGTVTINGLVTIDTSGNITTPGTIAGGVVQATTSLTVASVEMSGHVHYTDGEAGNTGPPI